MPFLRKNIGKQAKPRQFAGVLLCSTFLVVESSTHHDSVRVTHVCTSVARISYYAARAATTHAAFSQRKPHEVAQRHRSRQEIRDTWAENDWAKPNQSLVF